MTFMDGLRLFYLLVLVGCCGYALRSGGLPERKGALIILIGSLASWPAATIFGSNFRSAELGVLVVDCVVLVSYTTLALRCDRFWPLWITGFHVVAVATHCAVMVDAEVVPRAYAFAQPFWAYPMLVTLAIGTTYYRKAVASELMERQP